MLSLAELQEAGTPLLINVPAHKYIPGVGDLYVSILVDILIYLKDKIKERKPLEIRIDRLMKQLENEAFIKNAPEDIVDKGWINWSETVYQDNLILLDILAKIRILRKAGVGIKYGSRTD